MSGDVSAGDDGPELPAEEFSALGRALARDLPDAVVLTDRKGAIRYWNAGAERIFGYGAEDANGQSLDIIIPERLRARHWQGFQHMLETGRSRHGPEELLSVPAITQSGASISVQFTLALLRDDDGRTTGIVAVLRDVSETFDELKRLRSALRQTAKQPE